MFETNEDRKDSRSARWRKNAMSIVGAALIGLGIIDGTGQSPPPKPSEQTQNEPQKSTGRFGELDAMGLISGGSLLMAGGAATRRRRKERDDGKQHSDQ